MKHEAIAQEIYWAMEHGESAKVDKMIDDILITGITMYAWWKDGVQYVGTCGTTLAKAVDQIRNPK